MSKSFLFLSLFLLFIGPSQSLRKEPSQDLACKIILVRHGETEWNVAKKGQGWTDIPLNDKGRGQARALAEKFSSFPIQTIYSSSLSRASETAQIVAEKLKAKVILDPAIRFYHLDKKKRWSPFHSQKAQAWQKDQSITEDASLYFQNIAKNHPGETVLVVTHQAVVNSFLKMAGKQRKKVQKKMGNGKSICLVGFADSLKVYESDP